jgi:hypothetical protein
MPASSTSPIQDPAYAGEYLERVAALYRSDQANGGAAKAYAFTAAAAKYVAVAMAYDDVIRVADLKTRASRYERVLGENSVGDGQIVYTTEYMHPRLEEVAGTMPAPLGRFLESNPTLFGWAFRKGRRVRSGTIHWFLMLYVLAAFKRIRRRTLRHQREMAHLEKWLAVAVAQLAHNYDVAVEVQRAPAGEGLFRHACARRIQIRPRHRRRAAAHAARRRRRLDAAIARRRVARRARHRARRRAENDRDAVANRRPRTYLSGL